MLERLAANGPAWQRLAREADARAGQPDGAPQPLAFTAGPEARLIDFRGYAYTRTPSEVSGALMTRYDESTPQVWRIPLRDDVQPSVTVAAPGAGYLVPAEHAAFVAAKLRLHGVDFREVASAAEREVEVFRAETTLRSPGSVEGHQTLAVTGEWAKETRAVPGGSLYVPLRQPRARVVMALLEPKAPDSLLAWGEFNNAFERKEYMEDYVAEDVAREMLAKDPALKAEFEAKLRDDPKFAADPNARLDFFYRRHSAWDDRYGLYPVYRVEQAPE